MLVFNLFIKGRRKENVGENGEGVFFYYAVKFLKYCGNFKMTNYFLGVALVYKIYMTVVKISEMYPCIE